MTNFARMGRAAMLALVAVAWAPSMMARAQKPDDEKPAAKEDSTIPVPQEKVATTKHDLTVGGRAIHYTATAGNLLINDEQGKANASIFYVAYTEDGAQATTRPVTFFYNGGPGAASIWLHMGSFGPVRVTTAAPDATGPAPYKVVPNEFSLLDKSDLVFIDAPMCGYSRAVGKGAVKDFAGTDQDITAFRKFIERYVTANQRWNSPKFLFGESYGTTRSAGLVAALQNNGMPFNGVVLLSSILNYGIRVPGYDIDNIGYFPSYAAIAYYHHKVKADGSIAAWVEQARQFARGPYAQALAQGDKLSKAEFDATAAKVSAFTGLDLKFVKESRLRIPAARFRKELLRGEDRTMGRYDARFMGWDPEEAGETPGYDASETGISGAYIGAFHDYIQRELKYMGQETYYTSGPGVIAAWDFKHKPSGGGRDQSVADTALDLADAMRKNPRLKVFSANGYFDLATPFFATEYDLNHMSLPEPLVGNVSYGYYPAGHMVYLNVDALKEMKADMVRFYVSAGSGQ